MQTVTFSDLNGNSFEGTLMNQATAPKIRDGLLSSKGAATQRIHIAGLKNFHSCDFAVKQGKLSGLDHFKFEKLHGTEDVYVNISSVSKRLGVSRQNAKKLILTGKLGQAAKRQNENFNQEINRLGNYSDAFKVKGLQDIINIEECNIPANVKTTLQAKAKIYQNELKKNLAGQEGVFATKEEHLEKLCYAIALCEFTKHIPSPFDVSGNEVALVKRFLDPSLSDSFKLLKQEMDEQNRKAEVKH